VGAAERSAVDVVRQPVEEEARVQDAGAHHGQILLSTLVERAGVGGVDAPDTGEKDVVLFVLADEHAGERLDSTDVCSYGGRRRSPRQLCDFKGGVAASSGNSITCCAVLSPPSSY